MAGCRKIAVAGTGGHAAVVVDLLLAIGGFRIECFLDDVHIERHGTQFGGAPVRGGTDLLPELQAEGIACLALGVGDCGFRARLAERALGCGLDLPVLAHPSAVVSRSAVLGAGTVVCAGAVIGPHVECGEAVLINTLAGVDHHCRLEAGVHIAPGARLAGGVRVGREAWVGLGAVVSEHLTIGERALIDAGAVVVRDIPAAAVAYGVPAEVRRYREASVA